ncbi:DgyrCDS10242 [Dimorphilus gyrociliatus]|uniref:Dynein axonemal light chain 1 n=1 Tax=Dimorphilus gyrociliatus TaxID=2664684 RepID=A0A7I8W1M5_9ANNE|nr:DgyrCDS10242 [Dimorphilus gyrociliatus]
MYEERVAIATIEFDLLRYIIDFEFALTYNILLDCIKVSFSPIKGKSSSIRDALNAWEKNHDFKKASEAEEIGLIGQIPPIERMDASLSTLTNCVKLSLSTNSIEKIANLNGLKHLKILSLARNNIKNLTGLEAVGDTLEQLWISYNLIEKLKGVNVLKKLKVLYLSNNSVKDWNEFGKLTDLQNLQELLMVNNPLEEKHSAEGDWRDLVANKLPRLKKLDGVPVIRPDEPED